MRATLPVLVVALVGCQRDAVQGVSADVQVTPLVLDFGRVVTGTSAQRSVTLVNRSPLDAVVTAEVSAPFVAAGTTSVPAGGEASIEARFEPAEPGLATATLLVTQGTQRFEVELRGEGVRSECRSDTVCRTSELDVEAGVCVERPRADGVRCADRCVGAGSCAAGRCVGTAVSCDDADACTIDTCASASGCGHQAVTCAAPSDPCKVVACDRAQGCVQRDADDGTAGGPADCSTARVCVSGSCVTRVVPDGAVCAPATPCQGEGRCQQRQCVRPPQVPLVEAWRYAFPDPQLASFRGVADRDDNLYWVECAFGGFADMLCNACVRCAVTSYTRAGQQRFRSWLPPLESRYQLHLVQGDQLIYAGGDTIGALALADGAPRWVQQLPTALPGAPTPATPLDIRELAAGPTGVTLLAWPPWNALNGQPAVVKLDLATGALRWSRFFPEGTLSGLVLDESDGVLVLHTPLSAPTSPPRPTMLVSLTATGALRWQQDSPGKDPLALKNPVAVFNGELLLEGGELRSSLDGSLIAAPPAGVLPFSLMEPGSRTLLRRSMVFSEQLDAVSLRPGLAAMDWEAMATTLHFPDRQSGLFAAAGGGFLLGSGDSRHPHLLRAVNARGVERFSCPEGGGTAPAVAFLDERWASRFDDDSPLRVFLLPRERPATRGWVTPLGSRSGAQRPLP